MSYTTGVRLRMQNITLPSHKTFAYSYTSGNKPSPLTVPAHSIAINLADQAMYTISKDGSVVELGGSPLYVNQKLSELDSEMRTYIADNIPTPETLQLDLLHNYEISDAIDLDSSEHYASAKAVFKLANAYDSQLAPYGDQLDRLQVKVDSHSKDISKLEDKLDGAVSEDDLEELGLLFVPDLYLGYGVPAKYTNDNSKTVSNGYIENYLDGLNHAYETAINRSKLTVVSEIEGEFDVYPHDSANNFILSGLNLSGFTSPGDTVASVSLGTMVVRFHTETGTVVSGKDIQTGNYNEKVWRVNSLGDALTLGPIDNTYTFMPPPAAAKPIDLVDRINGNVTIGELDRSYIGWPAAEHVDVTGIETIGTHGACVFKDKIWIMQEHPEDGYVIAGYEIGTDALVHTEVTIPVPTLMRYGETAYGYNPDARDIAASKNTFWIHGFVVGNEDPVIIGLDSYGNVVEVVELDFGGLVYNNRSISGLTVDALGQFTLSFESDGTKRLVTVDSVGRLVKVLALRDGTVGDDIKLFYNEGFIFTTISRGDGKLIQILDAYSGEVYEQISLASTVRDPIDIDGGIFVHSDRIRILDTNGRIRYFKYSLGRAMLTMENIGSIIDADDIVSILGNGTVKAISRMSNDVLEISGVPFTGTIPATAVRQPRYGDIVVAMENGKFRSRSVNVGDDVGGNALFDVEQYIGLGKESVRNPNLANPAETGDVKNLMDTLNHLYKTSNSVTDKIIAAGKAAGLPLEYGMSAEDVSEIFKSISEIYFSLYGSSTLSWEHPRVDAVYFHGEQEFADVLYLEGKVELEYAEAMDDTSSSNSDIYLSTRKSLFGSATGVGEVVIKHLVTYTGQMHKQIQNRKDGKHTVALHDVYEDKTTFSSRFEVIAD